VRARTMTNMSATLLTVVAIMSFAPTMAMAESAPVFNKPMYAGSPHYYSDKWFASRLQVGYVKVWNDVDYLYISLYTTGDWYLKETHLAIATDPCGFPMNKEGNPKVGHFPYQHENLDSKVDRYTIALSWAFDTKLYIAAHAVVEKRVDGCVVQVETAWVDCGGRDAHFPGNNWAFYFAYIVTAPA